MPSHMVWDFVPLRCLWMSPKKVVSFNSFRDVSLILGEVMWLPFSFFFLLVFQLVSTLYVETIQLELYT